MSGDVCNLNKDENATMTGQIRRKQTPSDKIENKQRRKVKQQKSGKSLARKQNNWQYVVFWFYFINKNKLNKIERGEFCI